MKSIELAVFNINSAYKIIFKSAYINTQIAFNSSSYTCYYRCTFFKKER